MAALPPALAPESKPEPEPEIELAPAEDAEDDAGGLDEQASDSALHQTVTPTPNARHATETSAR